MYCVPRSFKCKARGNVCVSFNLIIANEGQELILLLALLPPPHYFPAGCQSGQSCGSDYMFGSNSTRFSSNNGK